jgi:hypothetical protein
MFWMLGVVSFGQTIQHSEGIVEIRSSPEDAWRPVRVGDSLEARGSLRTFQGDVTLEAMEYTIRLSNDSELWRGLTAFELIQGKSYIEAQAVKFHMGGPVKIEGKARLDASSADGQRLAVLSGKASATISAGVTHLESGQQALLLNGELSVSNYFERDPWYRNLSVLAEGRAAVVGMMGHAEIQNAQGWKLAEVDDIVEPGYNARTALDSWLELRFEDGSLLRLQSDTEIALSQSETFNDNTKRTLVTLQKGKLWAVIEDGQPFEIETPGLVAGVRGTKFRVDAADDNQDALLKTFEGVVAGIIGFEVIDVENGKQFEPQAGLAELQKDALDEFNLLRDKAISAPNLELDFPVFTDQGSILIQGQTDPGSIVSSNGRLIDATQGSLQIEQPLVPGFNLVEIRASLIEDGKEATIIKPIIRTGQEFTFALREPIIQNNQAIISGFVTPGSTIILKSPEVSSQLRSSGYFQISIPLVEGENTIVLEALSPTSQRQSQTFMLEP